MQIYVFTPFSVHVAGVVMTPSSHVWVVNFESEGDLRKITIASLDEEKNERLKNVR